MFDGTDILRIKEKKMRNQYRGKRIAIISQDAPGSFNPPVPIGKHFDEMFAMHTKFNSEEARQQGLKLLADVHVPDGEDKYGQIAGQVSGGQLQRINIALNALITKPEFLILDEVTTALDVTVQAQVLDLLMEISREYNITLLFVTHDFGLIAKYADRVVALDHGTVAEVAVVDEIFSNPQSDYVRGVLESLPRIGTSMRTTPPPRQDAPEVLRIDDLRVSYPIYGPRFVVLRGQVGTVKAADSISLTLAQGEILGLVGESGCGKTTTMRAIVDLLPRAAEVTGDILFEGQSIYGMSSAERFLLRRRIGGIPQSPRQSLNPKLWIRDLIAEGLDIHDLYSATSGAERNAERTRRVSELMVAVGLDPVRMRDFPARFSGGELQRVSIARALALEPDVLILDEPTASLDASSKKEILELLLQLQQERNLSYILITHELATVSAMCDRVVVMYLGRIVEDGPASEIFANPQHPYTRALVASAPVPDPRLARQREPVQLLGEVPSAAHIPAGCRFHPRCPYAEAQCETDEPIFEVKPNGNLVACHLIEEIAKSQTPS